MINNFLDKLVKLQIYNNTHVTVPLEFEGTLFFAAENRAKCSSKLLSGNVFIL